MCARATLHDCSRPIVIRNTLIYAVMLCMAVFLCAIMIRSSCSPFIWDGQCEIDFAEICEEIRDMYDES